MASNQPKYTGNCDECKVKSNELTFLRPEDPFSGSGKLVCDYCKKQLLSQKQELASYSGAVQ